MPQAPERPRSYHRTSDSIVCPRCNESLMARMTIRPDGVFATCTNRIRKQGQNKGCGQRLYLLAGPGYVHAIAISPDEFERLMLKAGDSPADVLRELGLLHESRRAA